MYCMNDSWQFQLAKMKHLLNFLLLWKLTASNFVCNEGSFRCKYDRQICVPVKWVCDGTNDCLDGSDEILCDNAGQCHT